MKTATVQASARYARPERVYAVMRYRKVYLFLTVLVFVATIAAILVKGFAWGIDFTGGTLLERGLDRPVTAGAVRQVLAGPALAGLDLRESMVQPLDGGQAVLIRTKALSQADIGRVDAALADAFGGVVDRRTEVVGPVIGRELIEQALFATVLAAGGILVYVTLRFEYRFGIAAIVALLHDVLVTLALYALLGMEVNVSTVAVVLTILGYSINDTIVIFDRVRERLAREGRRRDWDRLVDEAISQTLPRTVNTSGTTLFVLVGLLILGGVTIRDFALALSVGIVSGTYSTVCVASAIWVTWRMLESRRAGRAPVPA